MVLLLCLEQRCPAAAGIFHIREETDRDRYRSEIIMEAIANTWKKIGKQYRSAFFSTIIFAVISQGMGLFNKFSVSDDINYFFTGGDELTSGRWMLLALRRLEKKIYGDGLFSLPLINGTLAVICIAVSLVLLISLLGVRSPLLCVLLGGTAISIPCVTGLFGHMYVAHFYSFALLLSVFGPYLILKKDKWFYPLAGIGAMVCAAAVYQAYIPVMISVFLAGMIRLSADADSREQRAALFKKAAVIICCCVIFLGAYLCLTGLVNRHFGVSLSGYKNVDKMGKLPLSVYLRRAVTAYREFFLPTKNTFYNVFPGNTGVLFYVLLLIFILLYGKLLYAKRKDPVSASALFLLFLLIPLAVNFIFVMVEPDFCSVIMVYAKVVFFVLAAWILEKTLSVSHSAAARIIKFISAAAFALLIWMWCRFDNTCYLRMTLVQTQATRYYSTLVTRIQSVEGYDSWKNVSYIGIPRPGTDNSINNLPELEHVIIHPYFGLQNTLKGNWREYMRLWCGFAPHEVDQSYFADDPEVRSMPHYPDAGSIKLIGDTIVVRF